MLEAKTDEERKALRLMNSWPSGYPHIGNEKGFTDERNRDRWLAMLAEARAIVREEQATQDANPRRAERLAEEELEQVRAEIQLRSEVIRAFPDDLSPGGKASEECTKQWERFMWLLSRERELMAKSEPEGGDRG